MSDVGSTLRQARERKKLTIEQVSDAIHIGPAHLEALESDRIEAFRVEVYARGFLRSYASFLGLDVAPLLEDFRGLYKSTHPEPAPSRRRASRGDAPVIASSPDPLPRLPTGRTSSLFPYTYGSLERRPSTRWGVPFGAVLGVVLLLWLARSANLVEKLQLRLHRHEPAAAVTSPVPKPVGHAAPTPARSPAAPLTLALRSTGWVYLKVTTDMGKSRVFEGEWMPGEHQTWLGRKNIAVYADRGNNVSAIFNGKDIGKLANVRRKVWVQFPPASGGAAGASKSATGPASSGSFSRT